jgi:rhodanese-related sulfurtransferase
MLLEAAAVVFFSTVLGISVHVLRAGGPGALLWRPADPAPPEAVESGIPDLTVDEAVAMQRAKKALFVDARGGEAYAKGHIAGARNLPVKTFDEAFGSFFETVDPESTLITYCDGAGCPLALELAEKLEAMGYKRVYHLAEGWEAWTERGLPTEEG